jgi:hypothetical protein
MMRLVVATLALLAFTACGSVGRAPAAPQATPTPTPGEVQLTNADDGRTLTVPVGTHVQVVLQVPIIDAGDRGWSHPLSSNAGVLAAEVDTRAAAPRGVSRARFRAAATGSAQITASRPPNCAGEVCPMVVQLWRVTVVVS